MKTPLFLALLCLSTFSFGSTTCQSTFHARSGNSQKVLNFCVTENGNIAHLDSGLNLIDGGGEGYAVCGIGPQYWDLGLYGDSGNWLPAVITQPGGPGTFPLTITRSSVDGYVTLTQQFSFGTGKTSAHVKMTLSSPIRRTNVALYRFANIQGAQQTGDHLIRSSFVWNSGTQGYGFMATADAAANSDAGLLVGGDPGNICNPQLVDVLPHSGPSATLLFWVVSTEKKGSSSFDYVPMW